MSAYALIDVPCPHCHGHFIENAKLLRPGGQAYCPECESLFHLDANSEAMRHTLAEAKAARRRRKDRIAELRQTWMDPVPVAPAKQPPLLMTDVLSALDQLLVRLDGLHRRSS
ncbi:hypothetical protein [Devosia sp.]|uniref:hypothetical protein n=1 Tax=Devosia sp. TaxID=1871048 RepID=UPI003BAA0B92